MVEQTNFFCLQRFGFKLKNTLSNKYLGISKLPYNQNTVLHNNLKKIVENGYRSVNLQIIYSTKKLFQISDKLPTLNTSNVIYKFVCLCKKAYVDRTSNNLITRINQQLQKTLFKQDKVML